MSYYKPSGFGGLMPMVKNLLIINVVVFAIMYFIRPAEQLFEQYGALHFPGTKDFVFTQFITYMFMHASLIHLFFNMFALWMFGNIVEMVWGWKRFLNYYLACGLGAAIFHIVMMLLPLGLSNGADLAGSTMVGASGAIYGLLVAYGYLFPNNQIYIYFLIPIKAKYFVALMIGMDLVYGFTDSGTSNIAHFAHVGGALVGLVYCFAGRLRRWKR